MSNRAGAIGILVAVAVSGLWALPASAQGAQAPKPAPKFERIEDSPYLVLNWNCKKEGARSLVVEGLAEVPFRTASNIYRGEVTLVGLDGKGRRVSEATGYLPPVIYMHQSAPFTVTLGLTGTEARVDLYYSFDHVNGNRGTDPERRSHRRHWVAPAGLANFRWVVSAACPVA